jgi:hypothetical protein
VRFADIARSLLKSVASAIRNLTNAWPNDAGHDPADAVAGPVGRRQKLFSPASESYWPTFDERLSKYYGVLRIFRRRAILIVLLDFLVSNSTRHIRFMR